MFPQWIFSFDGNTSGYPYSIYDGGGQDFPPEIGIDNPYQHKTSGYYGPYGLTSIFASKSYVDLLQKGWWLHY